MARRRRFGRVARATYNELSTQQEEGATRGVHLMIKGSENQKVGARPLEILREGG